MDVYRLEDRFLMNSYIFILYECCDDAERKVEGCRILCQKKLESTNTHTHNKKELFSRKIHKCSHTTYYTFRTHEHFNESI